MIKGKASAGMRSRTFSHVAKVIAILFLLLLCLFIAYRFLTKREFFQGSEGGSAQKKVTVNYYFLEKCPFCVEFNPEWEKFVKMSSGDSIETNKIDGTTQEKYKSFPTVEIIVEGETPREYTGERTATAMMAYLKSFE
jgi:hypothetical protein